MITEGRKALFIFMMASILAVFARHSHFSKAYASAKMPPLRLHYQLFIMSVLKIALAYRRPLSSSSIACFL
jgi:hypothetical protein